MAGADPLRRAGRVSFGGIIKEVNLAFVPEAKVGDYVVVHVGLAISTVDESEAVRTLEYLREIGELSELSEGNDRPQPFGSGAASSSSQPNSA
jgi:hydrogenase expression/formation protein HypC